MTKARYRWLDEGIRVLAEEGATGVRIDRIAGRLGLSKGSFHHHFAGAEGFKRDLLTYYERLSIETLQRAMEDVDATRGARAILGRLTEMTDMTDGLYRPALEVAVRAWATTDADVREVQGRIDEAHLAALQRVWRPLVATDTEARRAAQLPYLLTVGAAMVTPHVSAQELKSLLEILLPIVPDEPPLATD